jgi:hypothetical protein
MRFCCSTWFQNVSHSDYSLSAEGLAGVSDWLGWEEGIMLISPEREPGNADWPQPEVTLKRQFHQLFYYTFGLSKN